MPEMVPHPIMFLNDSGHPLVTNVTWVHLFINGLPMVVFIAIQPILKHHELFTDYIQRNPNWAKLRSIKCKELEQGAHPRLK